MRIRKGRQTRGNIRAALAMASPPHMDDISEQLELVSSSRGFKQKIQESGAMDLNVAEGSFEKAPLELLGRLQISSTSVLIPPNRPYMNLDEFVTSLARTNCFPADDDSDDPHSDEDHSDDQQNNFIGHSCCSLTNSSVQARDDEESPDFGRMFGAGSLGSAEELRGDIAAVETSLRLATPSSMSANPHYKPANPRTTTSEMEAGAAAANQADQTMKSSTENVEQRSGRHTRVSSSPGSNRNRNRIPSTASFFLTDQTDTQEEASSDFSIQMAESSRRPPSTKQRTHRTPVSISSSTLKTPSNDATSEERKQKLGKPIAKRMMKRSGRPKKLKYLQQENVEELGNQCNRRDGKGWTCPLLAKPGYQLCDHHLDKLRCKPGSRAKYNKSKKKKKNNKVGGES